MVQARIICTVSRVNICRSIFQRGNRVTINLDNSPGSEAAGERSNILLAAARSHRFRTAGGGRRTGATDVKKRGRERRREEKED